MNWRREKFTHDQVMQQTVRQLMAMIVEQVDAKALDPAVHRKRESLHRRGEHVHHHAGHFLAHGHAVGTARDQDAAVRRVDLYVQRRLLGGREDWYQKKREEHGYPHER